MQKIKSFLKLHSLPILSGFLIGTTYIPFFPWALAFCLVPLWVFWLQNRHSPKTLFIGSWITQFILNLIGFHWVAHTSIEFGGFPTPVGYVILILFAAIAHLYYPIAAVLWSWASHRVDLRRSWLLIPLIFAVCESFNPTIFFWHLGYPWLWIDLPGSHMAEWIGFYGLNLVTLFMNLLVLAFVIFRQKRRLIAAAALFAAVNGVGYVLKHRFQEGDQVVKVLVVQANIGNAIKVAQERGTYFHDFILRKFLELTAEGLSQNPDAQLIIWPETAVPTPISATFRSNSFQDKLRYSIDKFQVPLLTGAYQGSGDNVYNALVLFNQKGLFVDSYHKTMLLAFGEYFPGATLVPKLKDWFPMVSNFGRGTGPKTLNDLTPLPRIGAQICYESLFDNFTSKLIDQNAQIIVNVTNDSWFGTRAEPYQHLYMTLARAIEFRTPLVRSTNTGISTAISAGGKIAPFSPLHEEWSGAFEVRYKKIPERTIYSYFAGHWPWILLVLSLLLIFGGRIVKPRDS